MVNATVATAIPATSAALMWNSAPLTNAADPASVAAEPPSLRIGVDQPVTQVDLLAKEELSRLPKSSFVRQL
jgi:hypothetical protein